MSTGSAALILILLVAAAVGFLSFLVYPFKFIGVKTRGQGFLLFIISLVVMSYVAANSSDKKDASPKKEAEDIVDRATPRGSAEQTAYAEPIAILPASEQRFIDAVNRGKSNYERGSNDMAKGASRPLRARLVCAALPGGSVTNWIGKLTTLSSNSDGKGVLAVEIAPGVEVKTWNNAMSDFEDHTLLDPQSAAFSQASQMSVGQQVRFSGQFPRSDNDCFREASMTIRGSMTGPEYILRFDAITASQ